MLHAIPLLVSATFPYTVIPKDTVCAPVNEILKEIMEEYKEEPIWYGGRNSEDSKTVLFVDRTTGSWSVVIMTNEIACLLDAGDESINVEKGKRL
jgi:hypothetical protein